MTTMESRQYKVGVTSHICHPVYTMYMSFASRHFLNSCEFHEGRKKLTSREKDLFFLCMQHICTSGQTEQSIYFSSFIFTL